MCVLLARSSLKHGHREQQAGVGCVCVCMSVARQRSQSPVVDIGRIYFVTFIVLQVSADGNMHVADVEVHVEDVLIRVDTSDGADDNTQLELSFALNSEAVTDSQVESSESLSAVPEDMPCFTVVRAQLDWFGSMCLSACKASGNTSYQCPVPLPSTGVALSLFSNTPHACHRTGQVLA